MSIWCRICQCSYKESELIEWTGGDSLRLLCPGCDDVIEAPDCFACSNSATFRIRYLGEIYYCCDRHFPGRTEEE